MRKDVGRYRVVSFSYFAYLLAIVIYGRKLLGIWAFHIMVFFDCGGLTFWEWGEGLFVYTLTTVQAEIKIKLFVLTTKIIKLDLHLYQQSQRGCQNSPPLALKDYLLLQIEDLRRKESIVCNFWIMFEISFPKLT